MEISVFIFFILNINLVLTDDSVAMESSVAYQDTQKAISEPVEDPTIDQIAESSHSLSQTYNTGILESGQNQIRLDGGQKGDVYDGQNTEQIIQQTSNGLSNDAPVNNLEILQPALTQVYPHQGQQVYVQYPLQPIRIFGAEASPLYQNQQHENEEHTLGYSSYIEHVSKKDEEEIKSALKEGSVGDIKRLVPKSGISFKIYKNDKNNLNLKSPKTETESAHIPGGYSHLHHRIKTELPPAQQYQTIYKQQQQPAAELEIPQQTYQQGLENSQNLLQPHGLTAHYPNQQSLNEQTHYFTQPEAQKTLQTNGETLFKPHFKINVEENKYSKATSTAEYNSLPVNRGTKHGLSDISNYPKQWSFDTNTEGSQKAVKKIKPTVLQYDIDPVALAERNKAHYAQAQETHIVQNNLNKYKTFDNQKSGGSSASANYQSSFIAKGSQNNVGKKGYPDVKTPNAKNRLLVNNANVENIKQGQIVSHLGTNAYSDPQMYKGSQSEYLASASLPDSEPAKSGQHDFITHAETKNIQNFDHQKALEGSTSFDIKNAIDTTGSLIHQTNVPSDIHSFDELHKQQFSYLVPKIPAVLDSGAHEIPIVEGHQIKDFGIASPQLSYQSISPQEVSGKFLHQPQTVLWSSENLKHGNTLTANDLHQPLIKLHLPKEELYQHLKTPNIELPTVSHANYQQKQPYVVHYDVPFVKYPQEIHFQPKTKTRIQNHGGNLKLGQPLAIDWSLFKSTFPNFNVNSLAIKPELTPHIQETGKKIVPILIRKRKNRSNNKQEIGMVVYGKVNNKRRPTKPSHRQEKNVRVNLLPEASNNVKQFEPKGDRKNEFSVSASYKVDRSYKTQ